MATGFRPYSLPLVAGGCFLLFCNWLFFNAGSSWNLTKDKATNIPQLSIMNTVLSAAGACTAYSIYTMGNEFYNAFPRRDGIKNLTLKYDPMAFIKVILVGCVAVTASCNNIDTMHAVIIGMIGACVYEFSVILLRKLEIDDPL